LSSEFLFVNLSPVKVHLADQIAAFSACNVVASKDFVFLSTAISTDIAVLPSAQVILKLLLIVGAAGGVVAEVLVHPFEIA
jgi:hypothetical protein